MPNPKNAGFSLKSRILKQLTRACAGKKSTKPYKTDCSYILVDFKRGFCREDGFFGFIPQECVLYFHSEMQVRRRWQIVFFYLWKLVLWKLLICAKSNWLEKFSRA
ncbi:hypothetical protein [Chloroherpeton thalassium]|uniref:hypothetical protein n=1 Tax=Chloroherpeton thalassium TaxID=100716 RepID=UPI0012FC0F37|nr:hypothetical protein [Chloroherpeton thalassium]